MDKQTRELKGSPSRDLFKWLHKERLGNGFPACDADLVLCQFRFGKSFPIALLDFKTTRDKVTDTERGFYDWLEANGLPVYIVTGTDMDESDIRQMKVSKFGTDLELFCGDWLRFKAWEQKLRFPFK